MRKYSVTSHQKALTELQALWEEGVVGSFNEPLLNSHWMKPKVQYSLDDWVAKGGLSATHCQNESSFWNNQDWLLLLWSVFYGVTPESC